MNVLWFCAWQYHTTGATFPWGRICHVRGVDCCRSGEAADFQDRLLLWLCHKSGKALKLKENLRRFWARLESKKVFDFNYLTINLTMFMTQS
jgi:hypothetical protein